MGDRMAKPQPKEQSKPIAPPVAFWPNDVGPGDFFRAKRKGNGWVLEMVRLEGDKVVFRRDVHDWDLIDATEHRLCDLAFRAERNR